MRVCGNFDLLAQRTRRNRLRANLADSFFHLRCYGGSLRFDRTIVIVLILMAIGLAARTWLYDHPQHDPSAPLDLRDPKGWATSTKLAKLRGDPQECQAVLTRSNVAFQALPSAGEGACRRTDRLVVSDLSLSPRPPETTCSVSAALHLWTERHVGPDALRLLGSDVAQIEHFGAYSCRRMYGSASGAWSEHATGNAVDIAAFVLKDGRRISILDDWEGTGTEAEFLHAVHGSACDLFGTVLSPDYNTAHRDHLHFDQSNRGFSSVCR